MKLSTIYDNYYSIFPIKLTQRNSIFKSNNKQNLMELNEAKEIIRNIICEKAAFFISNSEVNIPDARNLKTNSRRSSLMSYCNNRNDSTRYSFQNNNNNDNNFNYNHQHLNSNFQNQIHYLKNLLNYIKLKMSYFLFVLFIFLFIILLS